MQLDYGITPWPCKWDDLFTVYVLASNGARVDVIQVDDGHDSIQLEGAFGKVEVNSDTPLTLANANVAQLTVSSPNADVSVQSGTVASIELTKDASSASLATSEGSSVGTMAIACSASVDIAGNVAQITVESLTAGSQSPNLTLADTAKVTTLTVKAGADVSLQADNASSIGKINAPDADSVKIAASSDGVKKQIESKVQTPDGNSTNSGNTSSGDDSGSPSRPIYTPSDPVIPTTTATTVSNYTQFLAALENSSITSILIAGNIAITANSLSINKPVTLQQGCVLTIPQYHFVINTSGSLTNYGTINKNSSLRSSIDIYGGKLYNYGTIDSDIDICAEAYTTVIGVTGVVYAQGSPDWYYSDGTVKSGDISGTIVTDGKSRLKHTTGSAGDLSVYAEGATGFENALNSGKEYTSLTIRKAELASANNIVVPESVNINMLSIDNGVSVTIPKNAFVTAINIYSMGSVTNNGTVTCTSLNIGQTSYWNIEEPITSPVQFTNNGSVTTGRQGRDYMYSLTVGGENTTFKQNNGAYFAAYDSVVLENGATLWVDSPVGTSGSSSNCFVVAGGRIITSHMYTESKALIPSIKGESAETLTAYVTERHSASAYGFGGLKRALEAGEDNIDCYSTYDGDSDGSFIIGENITLTGHVNVYGNVIVPANNVLTIESGNVLFNILTVNNNSLVDVKATGSLEMQGLVNNGTINNAGQILVSEHHDVSEEAPPCVIGVVNGNPIQTSSSTYANVETPEEFWAAQSNASVSRVYYYGSKDITISGARTIGKETAVSSGRLIVPAGSSLSVSAKLEVSYAEVSGSVTVNEASIRLGNNSAVSGTITAIHSSVGLYEGITLSGKISASNQSYIWIRDTATLSGTIELSGSSLNCEDDVTFADDLTLSLASAPHPNDSERTVGSYIQMPSGGTIHQLCDLTVPDHCSIQVFGLYEVHGHLVNNGRIDINTSSAMQNSELQIMKEGRLDNTGRINNNDGMITVQAGGTFSNEAGEIATSNNLTVNEGGTYIPHPKTEVKLTIPTADYATHSSVYVAEDDTIVIYFFEKVDSTNAVISPSDTASIEFASDGYSATITVLKTIESDVPTTLTLAGVKPSLTDSEKETKTAVSSSFKFVLPSNPSESTIVNVSNDAGD